MRSAYSCTAYRAGVRKCKVLEKIAYGNALN